MNKNVKFLGAAAAALLTVAPIAAPVVSSVANTTVSAAVENIDLDYSGIANGSVMVGKTYDEIQKAGVSAAELNIPKATVQGDIDSKIIDPATGVEPADKSKKPAAGDVLRQEITFTAYVGKEKVINLKGDTTASAAGTGTRVSVTTANTASDSNGLVKITMVRDFNVFNNTNTVPSFQYNGVVYTNGQTIALSNSQVIAGATVVNGAVIPGISIGSLKKSDMEAIAGNLKSAISAYDSSTSAAVPAGQIAVGFEGLETNGDYVNSSNFYITYTATNKQNGKKSVVKVKVNVEDAAMPVFTLVGSSTQYTNGSTTSKIIVGLGADDFDLMDKIGLTAHQSASNNGIIPLQYLENTVNTNRAGIYYVTVKATNTDGKTSTITVPVEVVSTEYVTDKISYKPGYGVNVWRLADSTDVSWKGTRYLHDREVRTWDTKVVNGKSYTRVTDNTVSTLAAAQAVNNWVQTQYLASRNTVNNTETAYTGVITVKYNGKGGVALWTKDHKISGQYVKNGARYKAFATKTMGGKVFYRLGTQNQWIESTFVK